LCLLSSEVRDADVASGGIDNTFPILAGNLLATENNFSPTATDVTNPVDHQFH
jgi:hypothetical protein